MAPNPELLTTREVAELARVSTNTVNRWAKAGQLPAIDLPSGRRRYRRDDVDQLLATTDGSDDPASKAAAS